MVWVWKTLVEGQKVLGSGLLPPRWFPEVVKDAQLHPNLQKTRQMMSMTIQSGIRKQIDILHAFTYLFDARQNLMAQHFSSQDQSYYWHLAKQLGPCSVSMSVCCVRCWAVAVRDVRADAVRVSNAGELQIKASRATHSHTADKHTWRLKRVFLGGIIHNNIALWCSFLLCVIVKIHYFDLVTDIHFYTNLMRQSIDSIQCYYISNIIKSPIQGTEGRKYCFYHSVTIYLDMSWHLLPFRSIQNRC